MEYITNGGIRSDKIRALSLAKECYAMKLEVLTNATVVDDVIRFARHKQISLSVQNVCSSSEEHNENTDKSEELHDKEKDESNLGENIEK